MMPIHLVIGGEHIHKLNVKIHLYKNITNAVGKNSQIIPLKNESFSKVDVKIKI